MWKDVLYQGTITLPTGNAEQPLRVVRFGAADVDNAATVGNQKIADGWNIPMCWEHDDEALPMKLSGSDRAAAVSKQTFGHVKAFRNHEGRLQFLPDVYSEADKAQLNKTRYVSPQMRWNWTDATGKTWPGLTIQHVAATPIPKQKMQDAFAFKLSEGADVCTGPYRLCSEDIIRLSEGVPVAKEDDDKPKPKGKEGGEEGGSADCFKKALDALANRGIKLPDDTTPENLADRICIVCEALDHADADGDPDEDLDGEPKGDIRESTAAPPMSLSNADTLKLSPMERKALTRATASDRRDITKRVDRLVKSGRITPAIARPLANQAGKIDLSYSDAGELLPNDVLAKIQAYEALPANASWAKKGQKVDLSDNDGIAEGAPVHPSGKNLDDSPEARKARMDAFESMVGK